MKVKIILVCINFLLLLTIGCAKNQISIVTIFDNIDNAHKGGYYINGYFVNIDYETGQKLHLKKIRITGKVIIVKGTKHDKPGGDIRQGMHEDTKHILKPKIEIVN